VAETVINNKDPEVEQLRRKYDETALNVCQLFDNELATDITKKSKILEWASVLEQLMIKTDMGDQIHLIRSYLLNHIRRNGLPIAAEKYIYRVLQEYPQYHLQFFKFKEQDEDYKKKNNIEKSSNRSVNNVTDLPEESTITNEMILEAIDTLQKLNFKNMEKNQGELFAEKLAELKEKKMIEAEEAGLDLYFGEFNQFDDNKKNNEKYDKRISVPQPDIDENVIKLQEPIKKRLLKISYIFAKWANVELNTHPVYFENAVKEICRNLDAFIDFFVPTVDKKYRYSLMDWIEITYGWEDLSVFGKERLYPKPSIFCKTCKEHDYTLDPNETKGLQTPVMMQPIINPNRTETNPYAFVWQCPSCKGFDSIEVEITRERAQDNLKMARYKAYEIVNRFPLAVANMIYFHEWCQPYRLAETLKMTPKLEASK
jgi:hypothetical protein